MQKRGFGNKTPDGDDTQSESREDLHKTLGVLSQSLDKINRNAGMALVLMIELKSIIVKNPPGTGNNAMLDDGQREMLRAADKAVLSINEIIHAADEQSCEISQLMSRLAGM